MKQEFKLVKIYGKLTGAGLSFEETERVATMTSKNFVVKTDYSKTFHWPVEEINKVRKWIIEPSQVAYHAFCYPEDVQATKDAIEVEIKRSVAWMMREIQKLNDCL